MTGKRQENGGGSTRAGSGGATGAAVMDVLCALSFLTRLPIPAGSPAHGRPLSGAAWAFPLAGLVVGLIAGAGLALAAALALPPLVAALIGLSIAAALTGALHEDGFADTLDGLWGAADRERRLAIMRDSRVGGFGALGLVLLTGVKAAALAAVIEQAGAEAGWLALIAAAVAGRGLLPGVMRLTPPARETGLAALAGRPGADRAVIAAGIGILALPLLLGPGVGPVAAALALIAAVKMALIARWKIGGHTGDILGAVEQSVEMAVLLTAAAAVAW